MSGNDDRQAVLDQALFLAVNNQDVSSVRRYLAKGANPNKPVEAGRSAFGQALWLMQLDAAEAMMAYGVDVNKRCLGGTGAPVWTLALYRDAAKHTTARTEFCIRHGANFLLPLRCEGQGLTVLAFLEDIRVAMTPHERAGLPAVMALVAAELTREQRKHLINWRRNDNRKHKL